MRKTGNFEMWINKLATDYESLPFLSKESFIKASILNDPKLKKDKVSSDAFILFLDLYKEQAPKVTITPPNVHSGVEQFMSLSVRTIYQKWKNMRKIDKLPFFMKAYISTFYPENLDAGFMED